MNTYLLLTALTTLMMAVNFPLGYLRDGHERFAYGWYFYLYLSLPVVVYLKAKTGYDWKLIPVFLCGAVLGQSSVELSHSAVGGTTDKIPVPLTPPFMANPEWQLRSRR